jgi:small subunit ribosomal protein S6
MKERRVYETTIIINAALEDLDIDAVIAKITTYIENHGGVIEEINKWGRRRLAYPINKKYNGYYVHIIFNTLPSSLPVLERFLVLEDTVLRHLSLQLPQKLRDFRKAKLLAEGRTEGGTIMTSGFDEVKERSPKKAFEPTDDTSALEDKDSDEQVVTTEVEAEVEATDETQNQE